MRDDPISASHRPAELVKVGEYLIPFAKQEQLPKEFDPKWVDWAVEPTPASCMVIPNASKTDNFAQIVSVEGFEFVDAQGNPDADAAQVLDLPQREKAQKGLYTVRFEVTALHNEISWQKAKEALKKGAGTAVFLLKVKLKAARMLESMAVGMAGMPGLGNLFGSQVAKPVPATGKVKLRLEPPLPVIWSDEPYAEDGTKKITVDTSKEDGTEFKVNLYQYRPDAEKYEPTLELLDVQWTCDMLVKYTVQAEGGKLKVRSNRLILGEKLIDGGLLKKKRVGLVDLSRKEDNPGPPPIKEPYQLPVYFDPVSKATLHVRLLVKQCFFCDTNLADKQESCGKCGASAVRGKLDADIDGEKFDLEFPDLPDKASDYCYFMWKVELSGVRACPDFVTEYQVEKFT